MRDKYRETGDDVMLLLLYGKFFQASLLVFILCIYYFADFGLCFALFQMDAAEGLDHGSIQLQNDVKLFNRWSFDDVQVSVLISDKLSDSSALYRCLP